MRKDHITLTHFTLELDGEVIALYRHDKGNSTKNAERAKRDAQRLRSQGENAKDGWVNKGHVASSTTGVYPLRHEGLVFHGHRRTMRNAAGIPGDNVRH